MKRSLEFKIYIGVPHARDTMPPPPPTPTPQGGMCTCTPACLRGGKDMPHPAAQAGHMHMHREHSIGTGTPAPDATMNTQLAHAGLRGLRGLSRCRSSCSSGVTHWRLSRLLLLLSLSLWCTSVCPGSLGRNACARSL